MLSVGRYKLPKPSFKIGVSHLKDSFRHYSGQRFVLDLGAAFNVCLLDFPQAMAYAMIAGLPIQWGVYTSIIASLLGPWLNPSRFVMLGPTTSTSILLLSAFLALDVPPEGMIVLLPLLVCLVGFLMILAALLGAGSLTRYISRSVTTAYITAAACLIVVNQVNNILGYSVPRASTVAEIIEINFYAIHNWHLPTVVFSLVTALMYFTLRRYWPRAPHVGLTLMGVTALSVLVHAFTPIALHTMLSVPRDGGWGFTLPLWRFEWMRALGEHALAIAFLAVIETCNLAKHLSIQSGEGKTNLNQQVLNLGLVNLASALSSGMVVSGSMLRSQVNLQSHSQSPLSSILSGCFLALGIWFLGPYFGYVPRAALATLVTVVALTLIQPQLVRLISSTTWSDGLVFAVTFVSGLIFQLQSAIFIGATLSVILFLRQVSFPQLVEYAFDDQGAPVEKNKCTACNTPEISMVQVEGDLFFGSTDIFLDQCRLIVKEGNLKVIILRVRNARNWDATSVLALQDLITFARSRGTEVIIAGAMPELQTTLKRAKVLDYLGKDNCFAHTPGNSHLSTRMALQRAQELIGRQVHPIIKVFVAESSQASSAEPPPATPPVADFPQ